MMNQRTNPQYRESERTLEDNGRRFSSRGEEMGGSDISLNKTDQPNFEEDPEFLEYQERADIVEKYDKGTEGQEVDPWENPDFSLYHVTDRYGFVHENVLRDLDPEEAAAKKKEIQREGKWMNMFRHWDRFQRSIKLRDRVRKGVPDKFRAELWMKVLGVDMLKEQNEGLYDQLKIRARLLAKDLKQIDMDINRTYRDHIFFRKRYDLKQQSLLHVLGAYSMYNTEVGYCQGMSSIAALMLMYMNEEEAFWALHILMVDQRHAMHGFFVPGFPKLHRYQAHFERILTKYLSRLKKHMDKIQVPIIYTTKWWFGCFLDRVPFTLALRLWDMFIVEGETVMVAMSYNIMRMHQKILKKTNFEDTLDILQNQLAEEFGYPEMAVIESLVDCMRKLRSGGLHLPPNPAPNAPISEVPTKPFGDVLKRPMDDIQRSISVMHSRRTSRAPSLSHSTPGTPRHNRSKSREPEQSQVLRNEAKQGASAFSAFNLQDSARTSSQHYSVGQPHKTIIVEPKRPLEPQNSRENPYQNSGSSEVRTTQPRYSRSSEPVRTVSPVKHRQDNRMNGEYQRRNQAPMKSVESFYDNVPGGGTGVGPGNLSVGESSAGGTSPLNNSFQSEQESEYRNERIVRPDGSVVYETACTITKTEVETRTISSRSSAAYSSPSTTPVSEGNAQDYYPMRQYGSSSMIRQMPNNITYVEVVPESASRGTKTSRFPVDLKTGSSTQTQV